MKNEELKLVIDQSINDYRILEEHEELTQEQVLAAKVLVDSNGKYLSMTMNEKLRPDMVPDAKFLELIGGMILGSRARKKGLNPYPEIDNMLNQIPR